MADPDVTHVAEQLATARIVAAPAVPEEAVSELSALVGRPVEHGWPSPGALPPGGTEAAPLVHIGPDLPGELRGAPGLLWAHATSAGVDSFLGGGRTWPEGVLLTRTVGRMGARIAQYVLGWVLAECQAVPLYLAQHRDRRWNHVPGELAAGTCAVVFGTGSIGAAVARALRGADIRTVGVARTPREVPGFDRVVGNDEAAEVLGEARWIVNALPLTPATTGLFGDRLFGAASAGATFLNVGRGGTVDTAALDRALRSDGLRSAVLDVVPDEPAGPGALCWDLPRTVVTSHSAGVTTPEDVVTDFGTCWRSLSRGQAPALLVHTEEGY